MSTTIKGHEDQANTGYRVCARDLLAVLEDLPTMRGNRPYCCAFRQACYALVHEVLDRSKGKKTTENINRNELLHDLKARGLFWVSRLDCAVAQPTIDLDYQERCLAFSDFFAQAYELIREEL